MGRPDDRTARSSAPLHAARRTEGAGPFIEEEREKRRKVEKLRLPQFFSSDALQCTERTLVRRTDTDRVSACHSRLFHSGGTRTTGGTHNVRRRAMSQNEDFVTEMNVPKMQQAVDGRGYSSNSSILEPGGEGVLTF